jgi:hypothetical protein
MSSCYAVGLALLLALILAIILNEGANAKAPPFFAAGDELYTRYHRLLPTTDLPGYGGDSNRVAPLQTLRYAQSAVRYGITCITERGMCSVTRPVPVNTGCFCRTRGGMIAGRVLN